MVLPLARVDVTVSTYGQHTHATVVVLFESARWEHMLALVPHIFYVRCFGILAQMGGLGLAFLV